MYMSEGWTICTASHCPGRMSLALAAWESDLTFWNLGLTQGFINEMRTVAMRLHTKEQAPKEGKAEKPSSDKPMPQVRSCAEPQARSMYKVQRVLLRGVISAWDHCSCRTRPFCGPEKHVSAARAPDRQPELTVASHRLLFAVEPHQGGLPAVPRRVSGCVRDDGEPRENVRQPHLCVLA